VNIFTPFVVVTAVSVNRSQHHIWF